MKKQSQFIEGQNNAKSLQAMVYGDFNGRRLRKNKANQSQFYPAKGLQETLAPGTFRDLVAGKLNVFDGFLDL